VVVFSWSVHRDLQSEKQYTGDLRNRVVGARLQKDGLSPYFYKWKKGDGIRYYDPQSFDSLQVSNITASPFFHRLLYPVADMPQRTISVYWFIAEYAMLIAMLAISFLLAKTGLQQSLLLLVACLFLLTEAWKMHVASGQNYICIPFFAMAFYYCVGKKKLGYALAAGSFAVMLVLIRLNAILFFIPFLFVVKKYSYQYLLLLVLPLLVTCAWVMSSRSEMLLWKQYAQNIGQQIQQHQHLSPATRQNDKDPAFARWEGIDREEIQEEAARHPLNLFSENGNVFVLAHSLFHKKPSVLTLEAFSFFAIILLLVIFYTAHRTGGFALPACALAGFCLMMVVDLFSPIYRHQYYTVQWAFPLFISASFYRPGHRNIYILVVAGLLLNAVNIDIIPMEHTLGEYMMLIAFIVLSLRPISREIQ